MKISTAIGAAALLALATLSTTAASTLLAFAMLSTTAEARITAPNLSIRMTPTDVTSRLATSNGTRHMKKFNDDLPDDPPPKKTGGTTNGSGSAGIYPIHPHPHYPHNPSHYGSGYYDGNTSPSACKGRPC